MRLDRREILEQLVRLGIRDLRSLKDSCREFEAYWENILYRKYGHEKGSDVASGRGLCRGTRRIRESFKVFFSSP